MARYDDGSVFPIPAAKLAANKKIAKLAYTVVVRVGRAGIRRGFRRRGETRKHTSFPQSVKLKEGEVVVFAYIVYKSRKDRDRVLAKVMADPRMKHDPANISFDGKRMFWGGFKGVV
jgi:uncharacterized protein YbaA (DUF1428 family)